MPHLPVSFYRRDTLLVAEELMGQTLCRRITPGRILRSRITEVEAYDGPEDEAYAGLEDKACHAHRGKTPRIGIGYAGEWVEKPYRWIL